jgi:hypothetical protein
MTGKVVGFVKGAAFEQTLSKREVAFQADQKVGIVPGFELGEGIFIDGSDSEFTKNTEDDSPPLSLKSSILAGEFFFIAR